MKIFIHVSENGEISGWSSTRNIDSEIEFDIAEDHEFLTTSPRKYLLINGELVKNEQGILDRAIKLKDIELNESCKQSILSGFDHTLNGIKYHFSFDTEAQLNFQGSKSLLDSGIIQSINWTVTRDGVYERIPVTKEIMDELTFVILMHKDSNVKRYRDKLLPLVMQATTEEEINSINWNTEV